MPKRKPAPAPTPPVSEEDASSYGSGSDEDATPAPPLKRSKSEVAPPAEEEQELSDQAHQEQLRQERNDKSQHRPGPRGPRPTAAPQTATGDDVKLAHELDVDADSDAGDDRPMRVDPNSAVSNLHNYYKNLNFDEVVGVRHEFVSNGATRMETRLALADDAEKAKQNGRTPFGLSVWTPFHRVGYGMLYPTGNDPVKYPHQNYPPQHLFQHKFKYAILSEHWDTDGPTGGPQGKQDPAVLQFMEWTKQVHRLALRADLADPKIGPIVRRQALDSMRKTWKALRKHDKTYKPPREADLTDSDFADAILDDPALHNPAVQLGKVLQGDEKVEAPGTERIYVDTPVFYRISPAYRKRLQQTGQQPRSLMEKKAREAGYRLNDLKLHACENGRWSVVPMPERHVKDTDVVAARLMPQVVYQDKKGRHGVRWALQELLFLKSGPGFQGGRDAPSFGALPPSVADDYHAKADYATTNMDYFDSPAVLQAVQQAEAAHAAAHAGDQAPEPMNEAPM